MVSVTNFSLTLTDTSNSLGFQFMQYHIKFKDHLTDNIIITRMIVSILDPDQTVTLVHLKGQRYSIDMALELS